MAFLPAAFAFLFALGVSGRTLSAEDLRAPAGITVSQNKQPSAPVRMRPSISDDQDTGKELRFSASSAWFGPDTCSRPRTFTVTALEEDGTLWVRHWVQSDDPDYNGAPVATVTAVAQDNDVPATWATASRCQRPR